MGCQALYRHRAVRQGATRSGAPLDVSSQAGGKKASFGHKRQGRGWAWDLGFSMLNSIWTQPRLLGLPSNILQICLIERES